MRDRAPANDVHGLRCRLVRWPFAPPRVCTVCGHRCPDWFNLTLYAGDEILVTCCDACTARYHHDDVVRS